MEVKPVDQIKGVITADDRLSKSVAPSRTETSKPRGLGMEDRRTYPHETGGEKDDGETPGLG
jgi:hypothetical protein